MLTIPDICHFFYTHTFYTHGVTGVPDKYQTNAHPAAILLRKRLCPDSSSTISLLTAGPVLEGEADADPELPLAVVLNGEDKDGEGKSRVGIVFRDDWRDLPADNTDAHLNVTTNITGSLHVPSQSQYPPP